MKKISKIFSVVALAFLISTLFVGSALAAPKHSGDNDRPGWGHGDKHHHHTGPPGHSNRPSDRFGDGDGDGDKDDRGHGEDFSVFFKNLINFLHQHGFPNAKITV